MPVYASSPAATERRLHPKALALILVGHAVLLAAVMTAKMDLPDKVIRTITEVELIELPDDPPPQPQPQPRQEQNPSPERIDRTPTIVPIPIPRPDPLPMPPLDSGSTAGTGMDPAPQPPLKLDPVRTGPRFLTPPSKVRPPYPPSKLDRGEEAVLRLRLSIDERGRVVAIEPVGRADPAFLQAARRHLIAQWRYQPATENGRPVPSSTVISLRFEING